MRRCRPGTTQIQGRPPRCDDRAVLVGIIFVLRSGIPWEMPPRELGCSGITCWRRLRDWQEADGVWARLHRVLLERLSEAGQLDWSQAFSRRRRRGGEKGEPRLVRTRRIAAKRARSAMAWTTGDAQRLLADRDVHAHSA